MTMSLERFMELVKQDIGLEIRVCMPAHVVEYIPPTQGARPTPPRVRVRIDLKYARQARAGDVKLGETYSPSTDPKLPGEAVGEYVEGSLLVPVHFPGPWGMWSCGPLLKGEQGKLVWCDRSIDGWQIDGGPEPVDPVFSHTHGGMNGGPMNDAWFEPGVRSGKGLMHAPGSSIPTDQYRIGLGNGDAGMWINAQTHPAPLSMELKTTGATLMLDALAEVLVGAGATKYGALAQPIQQIFQALATAFTSWVTVPQDGGAALKAILVADVVPKINTLLASIAALKAKLE